MPSRARLGTAGRPAEEVILEFPDTLTSGTAVNIQDGTYSGGGPATVEGDTITLPDTGAEFKGDATIQVSLNGQIIQKGNGAGDEEANWASTTQLTFDRDVLVNNKLIIMIN